MNEVVLAFLWSTAARAGSVKPKTQKPTGSFNSEWHESSYPHPSESTDMTQGGNTSLVKTLVGWLVFYRKTLYVFPNWNKLMKAGEDDNGEMRTQGSAHLKCICMGKRFHQFPLAGTGGNTLENRNTNRRTQGGTKKWREVEDRCLKRLNRACISSGTYSCHGRPLLTWPCVFKLCSA